MQVSIEQKYKRLEEIIYENYLGICYNYVIELGNVN